MNCAGRQGHGDRVQTSDGAHRILPRSVRAPTHGRLRCERRGAEWRGTVGRPYGHKGNVQCSFLCTEASTWAVFVDTPAFPPP